MSKPLPDMTVEELVLAAALLEMAADEFTNHGCNDLKLTPHLSSVDDRRRFLREFYAWNGDPLGYADADAQAREGWFQDYAAMRFLAAKLRQTAANGRAKLAGT